MAIPKIIHFLWFSDTFDEKTALCLESWKKNLMGYEIKKWDSSNFPYEDFIWVKEAVEKKKWAFATDFFRLWVLYNYGGIYLDADVFLQRSFDDFLDCDFFIGTEHCCQLGSHCMGSIEQHPYIKECLDFYKDKHFVNENGTLNMVPVPRVMTNVLIKKYSYKKTLANFSNEKIVITDNFFVYPDGYFTLDVKNEKNVCIHLGLGSWRDDATLPNPVYYENLSWYFENRFLLKKNNSLIGAIKSLLPMCCLRMIRSHNLTAKNIDTIKNVYKGIRIN